MAFVGQRGAQDLLGPATDLYLTRIAPYAAIESVGYRSEELLLASLAKQRGRTPLWLVLLDRRGQTWASEDLARWLGTRRDTGLQSLVFAVGPASGWSETARGQAQSLMSFGPMTLPHELARLVLAEQIYRAFTILAGHPYHTGH